MKAQGGYFSCHKIFLCKSIGDYCFIIFRLHFHFLGGTKGTARVPLLPRERVSEGYIASIVSSWVPWWEGDLAIHHRNDTGDL